jgi:hypothetical protein
VLDGVLEIALPRVRKEEQKVQRNIEIK